MKQKLKSIIIKSTVYTSIIVIFVVALTIAILSSQGTTINPTEGVIATSIIKINITPKVDYKAYINDQEVRVNADKIEWIKPGPLTLSIVSQGFKEWQKMISLKAGTISDIYVQLIPDFVNLNQLTNTNIYRSVFAHDLSEVYFIVKETDNPEDEGLWRLNLTRSILNFSASEVAKILSLSELGEIANSLDLSMKLSKDKNYVLFESKDTSQIKLLDVTRKNIINIFPSLRISTYPSKAQFFRDGRSLILQVNEGLYEYDIKDDVLFTITTAISNFNYHIDALQISLVDKLSTEVSNLYVYKDSRISLLVNTNKTLYDLITQNLAPRTLVNRLNSVESTHLMITNAGEKFWIDQTNQTFIELEFEKLLFASNDLRLLIVTKNIGEKEAIYTISIKSRQGGRSNKIEEYKIDLPNIDQKVKLSANNSIIFFVTENADGDQLWKVDFDGQNKQLLYSSLHQNIYNYAISENNEEIYLVLEDLKIDVDKNKQNQLTNLFRVKLKD